MKSDGQSYRPESNSAIPMLLSFFCPSPPMPSLSVHVGGLDLKKSCPSGCRHPGLAHPYVAHPERAQEDVIGNIFGN